MSFFSHEVITVRKKQHQPLGLFLAGGEMYIMACLALWSVTDGFIGNFYWKNDVGEIKTPANSLPYTLTVKHKENKFLTGKNVSELSQGMFCL